MSDQNETYTDPQNVEAPELEVNVPQEGAQVGDEETQAVESPVVYSVVREEVDAQVAPPRDPDADKVQVHEVAVKLDRVITDPASPEAVQIPDAGRGDLSLPIHELGNGPQTFDD